MKNNFLAGLSLLGLLYMAYYAFKAGWTGTITKLEQWLFYGALVIGMAMIVKVKLDARRTAGTDNDNF